MQLIATLASGVKGAESGHAEIYVRGTSTRATYYTTAEGVDTGGTSTAISTGANITLDANGGTTVYVNQAVDIRVYDTVGVLVRSFTEMCAAPNVELRSSSFTGTDYVTGASAAGNPTTVQVALGRWLASAGADDYEVMFGGASHTIQYALTALDQGFYNVVNYGAVGDGVEDDTAAIQAAIDAAEAQYDDTAIPGTVYFPTAAYRITSALTVTKGVTLLGGGETGSVIAMDHATENAFEISVGGFLDKILVGYIQANTGDVFSIAANTNVYLRRCAVTHTTGCTGHMVKSEGNVYTIAIDKCQFFTVSTANEIVDLAAYTVSTLSIMDSVFSHQATNPSTHSIRIAQGMIRNCKFTSNATSGTLNYVYLDNTAADLDATIIGNHFNAGNGGTVYALSIAANFSTDDWIWENDNRIKCDYFQRIGSESLAAGSEDTYHYFGSLRGRTYRIQNASTTPIVLPEGYELYIIDKSANDDFAVTYPDPWYHGQRMTLIISNESGSGISAITAYSGVYDDLGGATFSLNDGSVATLSFVAAHIESILVWVQDGAKMVIGAL